MQFWQKLTPREQGVLAISAPIVGLLVIYLGLIHPLESDFKTSQQMVMDEQARLERISQKIANMVDAKDIYVAASKDPVEGANRQTIITQSARSAAISISRIQNNDGQIRFWIDQVSPSDMLIWLSLLQNDYGLNAAQLSMVKNSDDQSVRVQVSFKMRAS
mgnify:CR=1 FL=1